MSTKTKDTPENTSLGEIAARAYQLWEQAGRPAKRDLEFWLLAEKQITLAHEGTLAFALHHRSSEKAPASLTRPRSDRLAGPLINPRKPEPRRHIVRRSQYSP